MSAPEYRRQSPTGSGQKAYMTDAPDRPNKQGGLQFAGRAFGHRNYRLFFAGQGTSLIGTWMQQIAMSWLVYRLTGSRGAPRPHRLHHHGPDVLRHLDCRGFRRPVEPPPPAPR